MRHIFSQSIRAALFAALAGSAQAATITYDFTVPTAGAGWLQYDDTALFDVGGGSYTSALTDFAFAFNGWTYTPADATSAPLAWFADPGAAFVGIQYLGTHGADSIEFAAGFGVGDLGTFTPNNNGSPLALTDADFTLRPTGLVPEPGTLTCVLVGFGAAGLRLRPGKKSA